jgi:hypothetical protein
MVNGPDRYARSPWLVCKTWFLTCQHVAGVHRTLRAPVRPGPNLYSTCRLSTFARIVCDNFFFWERFQVPVLERHHSSDCFQLGHFPLFRRISSFDDSRVYGPDEFEHV